MAEEEKAKEAEKKVIVDEDWKQQAQREKEVLAAQEAAQKKSKEAEQARPPLPKGDFAALLSMLYTQAMYSLGLLEVKGQEDQKREPDLELAKYHIDMLETLEAKTRGNLSEEEGAVLNNMLSQLRMGYVKAAG